MRDKGHTPKMDSDGTMNEWVVNSGFHNGPGCEACDWSCCQHCTSESEIPECTADLIEGEIMQRALPA